MRRSVALRDSLAVLDESSFDARRIPWVNSTSALMVLFVPLGLIWRRVIPMKDFGCCNACNHAKNACSETPVSVALTEAWSK